MTFDRLINKFLIILMVIICTSGDSFLMPLRIYLIIIFGIFNLLLYFVKQKSITIKKNLLFGFLFILLIMTSVLYSYDKTQTIKYSLIFLSAFSFCALDMDKNFIEGTLTGIEFVSKIVAISIIINAFIPNLFSDYLYFLIKGGASSISRLQNEVNSGIYSGIIGEKGEAAFLMSLAIIITLARTIKYGFSRKYRIWFIVFVLALILPAKRMMFVISILLIFVFILLWCNKRNKIKYGCIFIIFAIFLLIIMNNIPQFSTLIDRFILYSDDDTGNGRIYLWEVSYTMFKNKKVFGYGYGSYNTFASKFGLVVNNYGEWVSQGHNIYLQVLGELGLVGLVLFILFNMSGYVLFFKLYRERINLSRETKMYLSIGFGIISFVILYGYSGNIIYYSNQIFVYLFGFLMLIYAKKISEKSKEI